MAAKLQTSLWWIVPGWCTVAAMALTMPRLAIVAVISFLFCDAPGCAVNFAQVVGAMMLLAALSLGLGYALAVQRFGWLARAGAAGGVALTVCLWRTMGLAGFG